MQIKWPSASNFSAEGPATYNFIHKNMHIIHILCMIITKLEASVKYKDLGAVRKPLESAVSSSALAASPGAAHEFPADFLIFALAGSQHPENRQKRSNSEHFFHNCVTPIPPIIIQTSRSSFSRRPATASLRKPRPASQARSGSARADMSSSFERNTLLS